MSPYFNFKLKAPAECRDGSCGKVAGIVVNPEAQKATDLIIESGFLPKQKRVLPLYWVARASEESVSLAIDSIGELERYPEYYVTEYEEPVSDLEHQGANVLTPHGILSPTEMTVPMVPRKVREGIVPGQSVVEEGLPVKNLNGTIGSAKNVFVAFDKGKITDLVVRWELIFKNQMLVPISMIEKIDEESILIAGADEALDCLPRYTPQDEDSLLAREKSQPCHRLHLSHRSKSRPQQHSASLI